MRVKSRERSPAGSDEVLCNGELLRAMLMKHPVKHLARTKSALPSIAVSSDGRGGGIERAFSPT
jgi:hypothetical protein